MASLSDFDEGEETDPFENSSDDEDYVPEAYVPFIWRTEIQGQLASGRHFYNACVLWFTSAGRRPPCQS